MLGSTTGIGQGFRQIQIRLGARLSRWLPSGFEQVRVANFDIQIAAIRERRQMTLN
jgi:hypothetical protein